MVLSLVEDYDLDEISLAAALAAMRSRWKDHIFYVFCLFVFKRR